MNHLNPWKRVVLLAMALCLVMTTGAMAQILNPITNSDFSAPVTGGGIGGFATDWLGVGGSNAGKVILETYSTTADTPYGTQWGFTQQYDQVGQDFSDLSTGTATTYQISYIMTARNSGVSPIGEHSVHLYAGTTAAWDDTVELSSKTFTTDHTWDSLSPYSYVMVNTELDVPADFEIGTNDRLWLVLRNALTGQTYNQQLFTNVYVEEKRHLLPNGTMDYPDITDNTRFLNGPPIGWAVMPEDSTRAATYDETYANTPDTAYNRQLLWINVTGTQAGIRVADLEPGKTYNVTYNFGRNHNGSIAIGGHDVALYAGGDLAWDGAMELSSKTLTSTKDYALGYEVAKATLTVPTGLSYGANDGVWLVLTNQLTDGNYQQPLFDAVYVEEAESLNVNGSFEFPTRPNDDYADDFHPGWVSRLGAGDRVGLIRETASSVPNTPDGTQWIDFIGDGGMLGQNLGVDPTPGTLYQVDYLVSRRENVSDVIFGGHSSHLVSGDEFDFDESDVLATRSYDFATTLTAGRQFERVTSFMTLDPDATPTGDKTWFVFECGLVDDGTYPYNQQLLDGVTVKVKEGLVLNASVEEPNISAGVSIGTMPYWWQIKGDGGLFDDAYAYVPDTPAGDQWIYTQDVGSSIGTLLEPVEPGALYSIEYLVSSRDYGGAPIDGHTVLLVAGDDETWDGDYILGSQAFDSTTVPAATGAGQYDEISTALRVPESPDMGGYRNVWLVIVNDASEAAFGQQMYDDFQVTQVDAPGADVPPADTTALEGTDATFTITANAATTATQWQFYNEGAWENINGETGETLVIDPVALEDAGYYRCEVANEYWTDYSSSASLTVLPYPRITEQPQSKSVKVDNETTFTLTADDMGYPPLTYQWQVSKDSGSNWADLPETSDTYTTTPQSVDASGYQYRCLVSNANALTTSSVAELNVFLFDPPETTGPSDLEINEWSNAYFVVGATTESSGTLSYEWQTMAPGGSSWEDMSASGLTYSVQDNANSSQLTILTTQVDRDNGRQFRCKVTDGATSSFVFSRAAVLTVNAYGVDTSADKTWSLY